MITHLSGDSKLFKNGPFRACMGCCVTINGIDQFNKEYDDIISDYFNTIGEKRNRQCIKSYDIIKNEPMNYYDQFTDLINDLVAIKNLQFNSFTTTFNTQIMPEVILYHKNTRSMKTIQFLNILNNYYNYISVWKTSKMWELHGCNVFLDSFTGEITESWKELEHHHNIQVFFEGDRCNRLISVSDIFLRFFEETLIKKREKIHEQTIKSIMKEKEYDNGNSYYIGPKDLKWIVPSEKRRIPLKNFYSDPIIFVIKEDIIGKETNWIK